MIIVYFIAHLSLFITKNTKKMRHWQQLLRTTKDACFACPRETQKIWTLESLMEVV